MSVWKKAARKALLDCIERVAKDLSCETDFSSESAAGKISAIEAAAKAYAELSGLRLLRGPQGIQGPQGEPGPMGPMGPRGADAGESGTEYIARSPVASTICANWTSSEQCPVGTQKRR